MSWAVSGEVSRKGCLLSCDVHWVRRRTGLEVKSREPRDQGTRLRGVALQVALWDLCQEWSCEGGSPMQMSGLATL